MIDGQEQDILDLLDGEWIPGSVSSGDALLLSSVSGGDVVRYYQINLYAVPEEVQEELKEDLWTKSLDDYTVSEGLLLFLDVMILVVLVWIIVKGGFKWQK